MATVQRLIRAAAVVTVLAAAAPSVAEAQSYWGSGASAPTTGDCDTGIQRHQDETARLIVDNYQALAYDQYEPMPTGGFSGVSCLDRLLNSSLDILFTSPSFDGLLSSIVNNLCSFATSMVRNAASSLSQSAMSSLPLGELVPGVNLGRLTGGGMIRPNIGGSSSGGPLNIMTRTSGQVGNLAGYWGGGNNRYSAGTYGALFGEGDYFPATGGSSRATGAGGWFTGFGLGSLFGR